MLLHDDYKLASSLWFGTFWEVPKRPKKHQMDMVAAGPLDQCWEFKDVAEVLVESVQGLRCPAAPLKGTNRKS